MLETHVYLTPREAAVLRLMADCLSDKRIASELGMRRHTASNHVSRIIDNYQGFPRKIANADDGNPESDAYQDVPSSGAEWCFKRRGKAGGVNTAHPNYWGPYSRAYCIHQSSNGAGVFVASNRNDYVAFRV